MSSEKHIGFYYETIFPEKSKIGHGGSPRNWIPQGTIVTEYSKTFLVFYKWPDLTYVQGIVTTVVVQYVYLNTSIIQVAEAANCSGLDVAFIVRSSLVAKMILE
jgi:hypothetical protein